MRLYLLKYDAETRWVEAGSMATAIQLWRDEWIKEAAEDGTISVDVNQEPESCELVAEELYRPVVLHATEGART